MFIFFLFIAAWQGNATFSD